MTAPPYSGALDGKLAQAQLAWKAPSVVAAVVRDGTVVWSGAVGTAQVGAVPAAQDVSYRIGSITKTFTAVLVLQLRDAGLLDLDDPLGKHLPGSRHGDVTLRRLLAHASGLQREPVGDLWTTLEVPTRGQLLEGFEQAEQVLPARAAHHYSNLAYAVLGEVVARVTGGTWEQALQERLLDPLGMTRTGPAPSSPRAQGYLTEPYADAVRPEPDMDLGAAGPAGQLWSTAADLARWAAFLADPAPEVLAVATLDEMRQPVIVFDPHAFTLAWGAGLMLWRRGERVLHGHGGAMPGFLASCYAYRDEVERAGAVVLTNTGRAADPEGLAADLLSTALDADPRRAPAWTPGEVPTELRELLGIWWSEGHEFVFEWRAGALTALARGGAEHRRTHFASTGPDAWQAVKGREQGERLRVLRGADGTACRLLFSGYAYTRDPRTFAELA
ncbi:MAG: beta-lactamase [Frankiales bacterium]|nr:beta-lactamase [Frankiales bacterium]